MTSSHTPGACVRQTRPGIGQAASWSTDGLAALSGGTAEPVARFRYDAVDGTWWWSPAMYALHGFSPGEVVPTTALLLAHKHADDRARTEGRLQEALSTGEPFCCRHRIIDASGRVHMVLSLAEPVCDDLGTVVAVQGFFIDVTDSLRRVAEQEAHTAVVRATQTRAVIEQAKGLLVGIYGIDPDAAFNLLRWHSQQTNTKIRDLADGLVEHMSHAPVDGRSPARRLNAYLGVPPGSGLQPPPAEAPPQLPGSRP
jgi:PAS domain S-box-containing protein